MIEKRYVVARVSSATLDEQMKVVVKKWYHDDQKIHICCILEVMYHGRCTKDDEWVP